MRITSRAVLLSLALALGLGVTTSARSQAAAGRAPWHTHVAKATFADGMTGSQLLAQGWKDDYELSTTSPEPQCHYVGRTRKVLIAGRVNHVCPVPFGYPVFYLFGGTCDTASPPPYYAVTAHEQRRCAKKADLAFIKHMSLSVDDGPTVTMTRPRFEVFTKQVHVELPENNIDGAPAGPMTFTAHGWVAFATHLSPGLHTTHFTLTTVDGTTDILDRTIRVVR